MFLGVVGRFGFGWITDQLVAAAFSPLNSRKPPIVCGLLGMVAFTYSAAETDSNVIAMVAS